MILNADPAVLYEIEDEDEQTTDEFCEVCGEEGHSATPGCLRRAGLE